MRGRVMTANPTVMRLGRVMSEMRGPTITTLWAQGGPRRPLTRLRHLFFLCSSIVMTIDLDWEGPYSACELG